MKNLLLTLALGLISYSSFAQAPKVIFQIQTSDTLVYRSVASQISNLKKEIPDVEVEVLCHGPGLGFLMANQSKYLKKVSALNLKNISFVGCEYSISQRGIKKEDLSIESTFVPFGIAELVKKQQADWIYIKAGF